MSPYQRIHFVEDPEQPLTVENFMSSGVLNKHCTAIISFDELYTLIKETGKTMEPFVVESIGADVKDDSLVTIRVKASAIRKLNSVFKNVSFK